MNWAATTFFGFCTIVAACTIVATIEDAVRGLLRARRVVREAEIFQKERGR